MSKLKKGEHVFCKVCNKDLGIGYPIWLCDPCDKLLHRGTISLTRDSETGGWYPAEMMKKVK